MTVYFANEGLIDLDVIRVMGVSVKEGDNPIGFFGTGLKYAIAVLLRTGHQVWLRRGKERFQFTARERSIRGKDFKVVYMNDERLGFTTELGKNWEVWQAYRELHSNTLDEGGQISDKKLHGDTVIEVEGVAISKEYVDRASIFLETKPISSCEGLEVHPGRGRGIYYRGVRCGNLPEEAAFNYNILKNMELSEDRMFKNLWNVEYAIETMLPLCRSVPFFTELLQETKTWDGSLDLSLCSNPSPEFLEAARSQRSNAEINQSVIKMIDRDNQNNGTFPVLDPDKIADQMFDDLEKARRSCNKYLGANIEIGEVQICESLGPSTMGIYHHSKDQIFLAAQCFDKGVEFVTAVLFEEWCHKTHKFKDKSRAFQMYLLHKLVATALGTEQPDAEKMKGIS